MMQVTTRRTNGITIADLNGRITLGEGSAVLRETIRELVGKGEKNVVLNLAEVNDIDSSGIGELVSAFTTMRDRGGELKLLNLTSKVKDLLQITKLAAIFDVQKDEAEALAAFQK